MRKMRLLWFTKAVFIALLLLSCGSAAAGEYYRLVKTWGGQGSAESRFDYPLGVAVDDVDMVYVADGRNRRIQKFDSAGKLILAWETGGEGDDVIIPNRVVVDKMGNVYVSGYGTDRIFKFDADGGYVAEWKCLNPGDYDPYAIAGIAVDSEGHVYAVAFGMDLDGKYFSEVPIATVFQRELYGSIQRFSSDGEFLGRVESVETVLNIDMWPQGLAVDGDDNLLIVNMSISLARKSICTEVRKYDADLGYVSTPLIDNAKTETGYRLPSMYEAIAVDDDGNMYMINSLTNKICKFSIEGRQVAQWGLKFFRAGLKKIPQPEMLAVDSRGDVYVTDSANHCVHKYRKSIRGVFFGK
ncbi:MAG: hypothetical protein GY850_39205 [bacterium]|nr:hypothetical protein [bacterium]